MPSFDLTKQFPKVPSVEEPKEKARRVLLAEYGREIHQYLKSQSEINGVSGDHLSNHKVTGVYRAKMVDWMIEVLSAFKLSDQTFFLAVNIMDRYFEALNKGSD